MAASNAQIQEFAQRWRLRCAQIRELLLAMEDDRAVFDDIYDNLTNSPDWVDQHAGNPPHLLTPSDLLAINTFLFDTIAAMRGNAQLPIVLKACATGI